jgi:nucleoside-diphosphate-sugar epimerase
MRILVTGASGLIGSALVDRLRGEDHSLFCQSRSAHDDESHVKWIQQDLSAGSWKGVSLPFVDVVYHLAGQTSIYRAREDPIEDLAGNVLGLLNLLEHYKKQAPPPFVVIAGTATEVGLAERLPIDESMPDRPITFYDISKLTAEMYLKQYVREGWVRGCALRIANVFGSSRLGQQADRGIIDRVFERAINGRNITIYGDGNYLRDYVFIDDVVSALVLAAKHSEKTNGRNYYVGSGQSITLKEAFLKIISLAATATGVRSNCEHVEPPTDLSNIEYRNVVLDFSSFRQATGWVPQFDFNAGLEAAYHQFFSTPTKQLNARDPT